ncbi:MAG: tRNA glutamyl-Q(34) synthetase GluQRS [Hyphomicrobiaceae bacterium]
MNSDRSETQPVLRFAPSPNGPLHLGHAYSALLAFDTARRLGGRFLLRIEDIDPGRSREEFVEGIYDDLRWLGLEWEMPVLRQSRHVEDYVAAAMRLEAMGVLYRCFATRAEIAAAQAACPRPLDPEGAPVYPGLHKTLSAGDAERRIGAGEPFAMRIDVEKAVALAQAKLGGAPLEFVEWDAHLQPHRVAADPQRWGDVVIQRKDVPTSYHLSVVVDDSRQGITHVVRGQDLYAATDIHRLLQVLLDLPEPVYRHHRLIADASGQKLAKSAGAPGLKDLRAQGLSVEDIRRLVGMDR